MDPYWKGSQCMMLTKESELVDIVDFTWVTKDSDKHLSSAIRLLPFAPGLAPPPNYFAFRISLSFYLVYSTVRLHHRCAVMLFCFTHLPESFMTFLYVRTW